MAIVVIGSRLFGVADEYIITLDVEERVLRQEG